MDKNWIRIRVEKMEVTKKGMKTTQNVLVLCYIEFLIIRYKKVLVRNRKIEYKNR